MSAFMRQVDSCLTTMSGQGSDKLTAAACSDPLVCHEMGVLMYKGRAWSQAEAFFLQALRAPAAQTSEGEPPLM